MIDRNQLGVLTKIGQGGQGVVYTASKVRTKFAPWMAYKEYKPAVLADIDFTVLAAMPALVEDTLTYRQAERLVAIAAWPCALVEDQGTSSGFVMPVIPEGFFVELTTVKGTSPTTAEFQHVLNHPSVLAARGIAIDDAQRYALLREVASGLAFLHQHGVCVGDISPKNLLFSLTPHEAVFFIDCDAMRINGVSALPQVDTPGWEIPAGEELATIYSDTYKLGLLALRLLAGDQDTKNPQQIPSTTPAMLRQVITDTLTNPPHQRPLPEAWTYVLSDAIEEVQHRRLAVAAPASAARTRPSVPVARSRPETLESLQVPAPRRLTGHTERQVRTRETWIIVGSATLTVWIVAAVVVAILLAKGSHRLGSTASRPANSVPSAIAAAPSSPLAKLDVRVYNVSTVVGAADVIAARLRGAGWNATDTGNLDVPQMTLTTVFYGSGSGERQAAEQVAQLLQAPVEPRTSAVAEQPPGVIVLVVANP